MNYTLNQLQIYLKVTQKLSITKAAEELNLTQPAVSIQLKNFQDQFDIPLTELIGRKLYVTDFGYEVALAAEKIIDLVNQVNYKAHTYKGEISGRLKIACVSTGKYVLPYFLSNFFNQNQGIDLVMDVTNRSNVIQSLEKNEIDFALVYILPTNLNIEKIPLLDNDLYLVSKKESTEYQDVNLIFNIEPTIFRELGSGTRTVMEDYFKQNKISLHKKLEVMSNEAVKQAIMSGMGCSIMPLVSIKNELQNKQLHIIPLNGFPIKSTWHLIWLRDKKFSQVAQNFLEHLRKEKDSIVKQWF